MSFTIITDTSSNLPTPFLKRHNIPVIPFNYIIDEQEHVCLDTEAFDGVQYYNNIRSGTRVTTSQIPPQRYADCFWPLLEAGQDILFVGMSSGISGAYNSAELAAEQLRENFPERNIRLVDTLAASLGEGKAVIDALQYREQGLSLDEAADRLLANRQSLYQMVLLEDLMYLHRGGRVSVTTAVLGTILGIRPLLKGNAKGELVVSGKVRGRSAGLAALAEKYARYAVEPEKQIVGIAHSDCPEDAQKLADMIRKAAPPRELLTVYYEPVTGAHVGPGTVALFFNGADGVREF